MKKRTHLTSVLYEDFYPFSSYFTVDPFRPHMENLDVITDPKLLNPESILIVWGGSDISPTLYNKGVNRRTGAGSVPNPRDVIEWECMKRAVVLGVPIIGVCRGAQMLCALAGGFLIQHLDGHVGNHTITTDDGRQLLVNSLHHQAMYPFDVEHKMLAWSTEIRSDVHWDAEDTLEVPVEPELVLFPKVKGLAVQWHPEMMSKPDAPATQYLMDVFNKELNNGVI